MDILLRCSGKIFEFIKFADTTKKWNMYLLKIETKLNGSYKVIMLTTLI